METHLAKFHGRVMTKEYQVWGLKVDKLSNNGFDFIEEYAHKPKLMEFDRISHYELFDEKEIDFPPLNIRDKVRIGDKIVVVEDVIRELSGEYIYHVDHKVREVYDKEAHNKAQAELDEKLEEYRKQVAEENRIRTGYYRTSFIKKLFKRG